MQKCLVIHIPTLEWSQSICESLTIQINAQKPHLGFVTGSHIKMCALQNNYRIRVYIFWKLSEKE